MFFCEMILIIDETNCVNQPVVKGVDPVHLDEQTPVQSYEHPPPAKSLILQASYFAPSYDL